MATLSAHFSNYNLTVHLGINYRYLIRELPITVSMGVFQVKGNPRYQGHLNVIQTHMYF